LADAAIIAAWQLISALQHPHTASPVAPINKNKLPALTKLAKIFDSTVHQNITSSNNTIDLVQSLPTTKNHPNKMPDAFTLGVPEKLLPYAIILPAFTSQSTPLLEAHHCYPTHQQHTPAHAVALHALTLDKQPLLSPSNIDPLPHLTNSVIDPDSGQSTECCNLIRDPKTKAVWAKSFANELGWLAQGIGGRVTGTNTCFFIPHHALPKGKIATYGCIVVELRPQKAEVECTRLTVGGDRINYPGVVSTETADLTTT
jgi:hypothetical protein